MRDLIVFAVVLLGALSSVGQQSQGLTLQDGKGGIISVDRATGWTETSKEGVKKNILDPIKLTQECNGLDANPESLSEGSGADLGIMNMCDIWGAMNRRNEIERVSFSTLVARLLFIAPPETDFGRYRGAKLNLPKASDLYDSTIIPDSLGDQTTCDISDSGEPAATKVHTFHCSLKTMSYKAAVEIEKSLVASLGRFHLQEDQIEEHGLAQPDKDRNECAPTGECTHANIFISTQRNSKVLYIQAQPNFIRNVVMDYNIMHITGHHNFVEKISPDSATVEVFIYSFDRIKTNSGSDQSSFKPSAVK